jgi:hypothetical protein
MLKSEEYANQILNLINDKMKSCDIFTISINSVSIPFYNWVKTCNIVNDTMQSIDYPYRHINNGTGWIIYKDRAVNYVRI